MAEWLQFHFSLSCIGEGNGNPLQCSCLENPRDGGAWWAAVYGIAQSRTWLKRLSSSSNSRTLMYMLSWNKRFIILTIYGVMNTSLCHYIFFYNIIFIISPTYCKGNKAQFRNIKKQNHGFVFMFWDFFPFLISFKRAIFTCGSFFFFNVGGNICQNYDLTCLNSSWCLF